MNKHLISKLFLLAIVMNANGQSPMDTILATIAKNNKSILSNTQYWETQKLKYKTGLTLYNPTASFDYLDGSPNTAGNQTDFTITQALDFPTAYIYRKQMAEQQLEQVEFHLIAKRQDILLEAQKICIELVYRNKWQSHLMLRKVNSEKLLNDLQTKLNIGEGNILDVNKAQLQLIEMRKEYQQNVSLINQLNQKLTERNGGNTIAFTDTIYPLFPSIPTFEQLETDIEKSDPIRKILTQDKLVQQNQVKLSKALALPKLETGYHYQAILGQTFHGVHLGVSIPLWENKNRVKEQQAKLLYSDLALEDHLNEHFYEVKQLYEKYANLEITLHQYNAIFTTLRNTSLVNKSLALGQISTIEYFMEISYYHIAYNNYLLTEKEYYDVKAELGKYKL